MIIPQTRKTSTDKIGGGFFIYILTSLGNHGIMKGLGLIPCLHNFSIYGFKILPQPRARVKRKSASPQNIHKSPKMWTFYEFAHCHRVSPHDMLYFKRAVGSSVNESTILSLKKHKKSMFCCTGRLRPNPTRQVGYVPPSYGPRMSSPFLWSFLDYKNILAWGRPACQALFSKTFVGIPWRKMDPKKSLTCVPRTWHNIVVPRG